MPSTRHMPAPRRHYLTYYVPPCALRMVRVGRKKISYIERLKTPSLWPAERGRAAARAKREATAEKEKARLAYEAQKESEPAAADEGEEAAE